MTDRLAALHHQLSAPARKCDKQVCDLNKFKILLRAPRKNLKQQNLTGSKGGYNHGSERNDHCRRAQKPSSDNPPPASLDCDGAFSVQNTTQAASEATRSTVLTTFKQAGSSSDSDAEVLLSTQRIRLLTSAC